VQRFNWDLQSQPVVSFPGMVLWGATTNGPTVLPGAYQARLTVDGKTLSQPFTVKKHPWRQVSEADLQEQFDLASRIRDRVNEANNAVINIRRIKRELADRVDKSKNADVKALAEQLQKELTAVEEDVYQVRNQSNRIRSTSRSRPTIASRRSCASSSRARASRSATSNRSSTISRRS
jgi:hypothetical protein